MTDLLSSVCIRKRLEYRCSSYRIHLDVQFVESTIFVSLGTCDAKSPYRWIVSSRWNHLTEIKTFIDLSDTMDPLSPGRAPIAQLGERRTLYRKVAGLILTGGVVVCP